MNEDNQEDVAAAGGGSGANAGFTIRLVKEETGEELVSVASGQG